MNDLVAAASVCTNTTIETRRTIRFPGVLHTACLFGGVLGRGVLFGGVLGLFGGLLGHCENSDKKKLSNLSARLTPPFVFHEFVATTCMNKPILHTYISGTARSAKEWDVGVISRSHPSSN